MPVGHVGRIAYKPGRGGRAWNVNKLFRIAERLSRRKGISVQAALGIMGSHGGQRNNTQFQQKQAAQQRAARSWYQEADERQDRMAEDCVGFNE